MTPIVVLVVIPKKNVKKVVTARKTSRSNKEGCDSKEDIEKFAIARKMLRRL